jgi:hypothetical protein
MYTSLSAGIFPTSEMIQGLLNTFGDVTPCDSRPKYDAQEVEYLREYEMRMRSAQRKLDAALNVRMRQVRLLLYYILAGARLNVGIACGSS